MWHRRRPKWFYVQRRARVLGVVELDVWPSPIPTALAKPLSDAFQSDKARIDRWLISEVYYPEETSTGHYMTLIAEGLAQRSRVGVICARPNYSRRGTQVAARETRHGVDIFRCWSSTFDKNRLPLRLINMVTLGVVMFFTVLRRIRRHDRVLVGTNPPVLPFLVAVACRLRGARCTLKIEDVYPDNMIAAGLISLTSVTARLLNAMNSRLYRCMDTILVLGRDMERCVRDKAGPRAPRIIWIPNWADIDVIRPVSRSRNELLAELGLEQKFVLGFAGNLGPLQGIEYLCRCAEQLREVPDVHFVFVGSGKMSAWLAGAVAEKDLKNVTLVGPRPRSDQENFLNACDLGLVSLVAGMAGIGIPSRTYNLMAAGKPILAAVDSHSEIAMIVREEQMGWVVASGDVDAFVNAVLEAKFDRGRLTAMGQRARQAAESKYARDHIVERYCQLLT